MICFPESWLISNLSISTFCPNLGAPDAFVMTIGTDNLFITDPRAWVHGDLLLPTVLPLLPGVGFCLDGEARI